MCRGREMQARRPPLHISFVHHQETTHNDSIAASNIKSAPLLQEITRASIAGSGLLIYSPRRYPAGRASCDGVGLAIVAAIQAELHESEKPTSLGSGMINSIAAAGRRPLSNSPSPSAPPPHNISRPMPISLGQARQNKSLLPSLDSFTVNSKESKLSAHNCSNVASCRRINHKSTHTNQRINNNVDDIRARESIFSTALSPPCSSFSSNLTPSPDFLGACFFCKRPLGPGKDIYMYRGDRAFCTTECRYEQIVVDERKERFLSTARKGNQASAINKPSHRLRVEATIAVFG